MIVKLKYTKVYQSLLLSYNISRRRLHPEFISKGITDSDSIKSDKGVTENIQVIMFFFY